MEVLTRLAIGLVLSGAIGLLAYRRDALTSSGVAGAMLVGTLIFGFGGWTWGLTLIAFFVSSSLLSHYRRAEKEAVAEQFDKNERRDLGQVLANGGLGALLALAVYFLVDLAGQARAGHPLYVYLTVAYFGVMATVNADTWATELGVLARNRPILLTTGQSVEPGTSGAITATGTTAALAGSAVIALVGGLFTWQDGLGPALAIALGGTLAGLLGSLFDSLLGATVQAIYFVDALDKETEQHPLHRSGHPTRHIRGWAWLNNDLVNFIASIVGAALATGLFAVLA